MYIYDDIFLVFDDYFEICYFTMSTSKSLDVIYLFIGKRLLDRIVNNGTRRIWKQKKSENKVKK